MAPSAPSTSRPIRLALQGGGSHGALAWGVLDRLLEEPDLQITDISGTSAGAMNAVVLASAFETGGAEGARRALRAFWTAVSDAARFSPLQPGFWECLTGGQPLHLSPAYLMMDNLSRMFSPYELNPLNINPLRPLLREHVNFDILNSCRKVQVHITATNVRSGQARTFSTGGLSEDAVLASACLPQMFQAVEIEGEHYWDGGFAANPALFPLLADNSSPDVLIVQLNPMMRDELPRTARDIINRVNEISFNTSLLKELRTLDLLRHLTEEGYTDLPRPARLHMIHCAEDVQQLDASSKMNADMGYLQRLFERGREWASDWITTDADKLGKMSSFDLSSLFSQSHLPAHLEPAGHDAALKRHGGKSAATQRSRSSKA